jgi:hypothetical protein
MKPDETLNANLTLTPSPCSNCERVGVRAFAVKTFRLLTPALSSLERGEGENGAVSRCAHP